MAHCCSWCPCRPSLTIFAMFLLAAETCILIIMIHSAFEPFGKEHILEVTLFRKRYAQVYILLYTFFSGLLLLVDISTLILFASGKYKLTKSFILHTAVLQVLLNLPFGISGIYLCTQMNSMPIDLFGGSWVDAFLLIRRKSMELIPPELDVSEEDVSNLESAFPSSPDYTALEASETTSNFGEMLKYDELFDMNDTSISSVLETAKLNDVASINMIKTAHSRKMGIRGIRQNYEVLSVLDAAFATVATVQRILRCCGLHSSEDWLDQFSGNFTVAEPSLYRVWWMNTSRLLVFHYHVVVGMRFVKPKYQLMSVLLVGVCLYHMILAMLNYFLVERKRRIARYLYIRSWQNQLQVTLQQQKRNAMLGTLCDQRNDVN